MVVALHSGYVRRILSISLLLVMSLSLVAPLLASVPASKLPMCCRRNGVHHCSGTVVDISGDGSRVKLVGPRCPMNPKAVPASHGQQKWTLGPEQSQFAAVVAHPSARPQTEARYRISFGRSRQKRGPPSFFL